jgi:CHRD domain
VKKTVVLSAAAICAVALVVAGAATARTEATTIRVGAALDTEQEVPRPTGTADNARGSFSATIEKAGSGGRVDYDMIFRNLTGPAVAAHIHIGRRGDAGPVAAPLCSPCTSPAGGEVTVNAATLQALQTGGAYVNVHTGQNAGGEIRGQIDVDADFVVRLSPRNEVPRPKGNVRRATGVFRADVTKSGPTAQLDWRLTFSRLTGRVIGAQIHRGAPGTTGRIVVALCGPCKSGVQKSVRLRPALVEALEDGLLYVNVRTRTNKKGEIRGQIKPVALTIS